MAHVVYSAFRERKTKDYMHAQCAPIPLPAFGYEAMILREFSYEEDAPLHVQWVSGYPVGCVFIVVVLCVVQTNVPFVQVNI